MARTTLRPRAEPKLLCPDVAKHHEPGCPDGYLDRQDWFEKMARTHRQTRCPTCKLYVIWVPKKRRGKPRR